MRNWRKLAQWTAAGLAIFALLGVLLAYALFDEEDIKEAIRANASDRWSRDIQIGKLSLHMMPVPTLHAKDVKVLNPAWAHDRYLLEADHLSARLSLLPLLGGQLVVSKVSMDGLRLNSEVTADGKKSWMPDRMAESVPARAPTVPASSAAAGFHARQLTALHIGNAEIKHLSANGLRSWRIDTLSAQARPGWKGVKVDAHIAHGGYPLQIEAKFNDLSQIGTPGAVSEGQIRFNWHQAELALSGKFPLGASLDGHALRAEFDAASLNGLLGFFSIPHEPTAALKGRADLHHSQGKILIDDLALSLGQLNVAGDAKLSLSGPRPYLEASLATDRLDWVQALLDAGRPPLPPKPAGEMFRDNPLAWPLLLALQGSDGKLDLKIKHLRLRSGTEITDTQAHMAFHDDRVNVADFSGRLLDGSISGNMQLDGRKKQVQLDLAAHNISLQRWQAQKRGPQMISGGAMEIRGTVSASGASFKALAASLNGPVTVRIGPAKIHSKSAQQAEFLLTGLLPVLSAANADHVELACASLRLPFAAGRAVAEPIAGARSNASQLLTSGFIDLRRQTLDLRGRVRARSGISLGVATLTGDIKIDGKILRPKVSLDPGGTPGALARIGAAIATGGVSILATALWDAANPGSDPCQIVLPTNKKEAGAVRATRDRAPPSPQRQSRAP